MVDRDSIGGTKGSYIGSVLPNCHITGRQNIVWACVLRIQPEKSKRLSS